MDLLRGRWLLGMTAGRDRALHPLGLGCSPYRSTSRHRYRHGGCARFAAVRSARCQVGNVSVCALALLGEPEVVFLDELTTGLDPQARRTAWDLVRSVRERCATVVLVTHLMEEAEALCDRVAVVDRGRVVALDRPGRLTAELGGPVEVTFT